MRRNLLRTGLLVGALSFGLILGACGSPSTSSEAADTGAGASPGGGTIAVVASTNVYGNIAEAVGGDAVEVSSIISNPEQDPHSYEGSTQVALQLSKARLVVENGGGYDDFVDTLLKAGTSKPVVLNAVEISGLQAPPGGELNEHVWYDLPSVQKIASRIAAELGQIDPDRAALFQANATTFNARVDELISTEATLKKKHSGEGVAITEPVPVYLLDAIGLDNRTPEEFSEAIEEGEDVSAAVLKQTLDLFANRQVRALVYNAQTSGPITERVSAAAEQAGVAVVPVTETLPQGQTYLTWMAGNVAAVGRALGTS